MPPTYKATLELNQQQPYEGRRLHSYGKGEEIPVLPQGVWQVEQGIVQLSTLGRNGEEILLGWAGPSAFFGHWIFPSLKAIHQSQISSPTTYHALSDAYLKWYSFSEIETSPHLALAILAQVAKRVRQTEALLAIAGQRRVEDRLQQLLLLLKQEMGQPVAEGTRLVARLTHQHIASAIGTTRVTVTRLLSKMQQQGWITLDRDRHIILKEESFPCLSEW